MPNKKTKFTPSTESKNVLRAIKVVKIDIQSIRSTAEQFDIPKTNLFRYIQKIDAKFPDFAAVSDTELLDFIQIITSKSNDRTVFVKKSPVMTTALAHRSFFHQVFSDEEEMALVEYAVRCCNHYYGLSIT